MRRNVSGSVRLALIALAATTLACGQAGVGADDGQDSGDDGRHPELTAAVVPLAKAPGWRDGFDDPGAVHALLEVAYTADTAAAAWADNVPSDLEPRDGEAVSAGLYADLEDVDLGTHAIVVWSSGQSGSCPSWLADVDTTQDGAVAIEIGSNVPPDEACTADYVPYRMVLAVDRDRLPHPDDLPAEVERLADGRMERYPATPG